MTLACWKLDESTINFDINLKDFQLDEQRNLSKIDNLRIVAKLPTSNKGIKKQPNIMRLLVAGSIEFIKYLGTKKRFSIFTSKTRFQTIFITYENMPPLGITLFTRSKF